MSAILSYFKSMDDAKTAKEVLLQKGFDTVQIDTIDLIPDVDNAQLNSPISGSSTSQAGLSLYQGENILSPDAKILQAASPMVSGYGNFEEVADTNVILTVVTESERVREAVNIIEKHGGDA